jgi:hypothetical protein
MKYAVDMGSVAVIYIPFVKIDTDLQKLIMGDSQTPRGDRIGLLSFLKMTKVG